MGKEERCLPPPKPTTRANKKSARTLPKKEWMGAPVGKKKEPLFIIKFFFIDAIFFLQITFKDASTSPRSSPASSPRVCRTAKVTKVSIGGPPATEPAKRGATISTNPELKARLSGDLPSEDGPRTPIKIYAKCLCSDIEYKTLSVSPRTTARELIWTLLSKYRMRHRDPKLFYLTMDIAIRRTGIPLRRSLALDDDSRPAELQSCHPWGECKFTLQSRRGGVVRVHDSVLMAESRYKCLLVSEETTAEEVVRMLFHLYRLESQMRTERFCLHEQSRDGEWQRRLEPDDRPMQVWHREMFLFGHLLNILILGSGNLGQPFPLHVRPPWVWWCCWRQQQQEQQHQQQQPRLKLFLLRVLSSEIQQGFTWIRLGKVR